jgi:hypothetical protein
MLCIYYRQQRALSDKWAEEALYDICPMRMFARLEVGLRRSFDDLAVSRVEQKDGLERAASTALLLLDGLDEILSRRGEYGRNDGPISTSG